MKKINIELIKKTLKSGKKLVATRVLPYALSIGGFVGVLSATTTTASAANVKFDKVTITTKDGQSYAKEEEYKSSSLSDSKAEEVEKILDNVDISYNTLYTILANGGLNIDFAGSKNNSIARFLAHVNYVENYIERNTSKESSSVKKIINKYVESKTNEAKLIYSNIVGIDIEDIEDYAKKYSCAYSGSINSSGNTYVAVYQIKNGRIISNDIISFNDGKLSKDKVLIKMPKLEVSYKSSTSSVPTFNTSYTGLIVSSSNLTQCKNAIKEADKLYDKIENAIEKGNYKKKSNQSERDILVSIYGDTNLINQTLNTKYNSIATTLNQYLNYKQNLMVSKVYDENSKSINYLTYTQFAINNKPVRVNEKNGLVYYNISNSTYTVDDKGYIKTTDFTSTPGNINNNVTTNALTPVKIDAYLGLNLYVDGQLYIPKNVNNQKVEPFIYSGITYLPVRDVTNLYGASIRWDASTNSVYIEPNSTDEYDVYEKNGIRYYTIDLPSVPKTDAKPSNGTYINTVTAYKGVNVYFKNKLTVEYDNNGNVLEPLNINGTVYLPARLITSLFNAKLAWDGNTKSVMMTRNNILSYEQIKTGDYYIKDPVTGEEIAVPVDRIEFGNVSTGEKYVEIDGQKMSIEEAKQYLINKRTR